MVLRVSLFSPSSLSLLRARKQQKKAFRVSRAKKLAHQPKKVDFFRRGKKVAAALFTLFFSLLLFPLSISLPPRAQGSAPSLACPPPSAQLERVHRCEAIGRSSLECARRRSERKRKHPLGERKSSLQHASFAPTPAAAPTASIRRARLRRPCRFRAPILSPLKRLQSPCKLPARKAAPLRSVALARGDKCS